MATATLTGEDIEENLGEVHVIDSAVDRTVLSSSPEIDFELCKTSVTERLKTFAHWPLSAQVSLRLREIGLELWGM